MKNIIRAALLLFLSTTLFLSTPAPPAANAQTQDAASWVKISPPGEKFTVLMPQVPIVTTEKKRRGKLSVEARVYSVTTGQNNVYTIWSLMDTNNSALTDEATEDYLDSCIDIVWNEVVKPKLEEVSRDKYSYYEMPYVRPLQPSKIISGREYWIHLGPQRGIAQIYYTGLQTYIVMALNVRPEVMGTARQFIDSFIIKESAAPAPAARQPTQIEPEPSVKEVFAPREVTQKARLLSRPEPQYTEAARRYLVSGTVVLRAILSSDGKVIRIRTMQRLPHGLTRKAVEAAQRISFEPAIKDGQPVSQYIQIEYNFNLY